MHTPETAMGRTVLGPVKPVSVAAQGGGEALSGAAGGHTSLGQALAPGCLTLLPG